MGPAVSSLLRGLSLCALLGCAHAPVAPALCADQARDAGQNLLLFHDNDLGYPFTLREVQLELDGSQLLYMDAASLPACSRNLRVYGGHVADGSHVLTLRLRFDAPGVVVEGEAHNRQDVLVESKYAFEMRDGRNATVRARAFLEDLAERSRVPTLQFLELHTPVATQAMPEAVGKN
jgi:hypothetical protein